MYGNNTGNNIWNKLLLTLVVYSRQLKLYLKFFIQSVIDSPVSPITSAAPLAFVIVVTAVKQGYEDWVRHKADDVVNNRQVRIVKDGQLVVS